MHTENHIEIDGPAGRVYELAADIGAWPAWLPHYRWVTIFEEDGRRRVAEMAAQRGRFPVKWRTVQTLSPEERRIAFRHTGGITKGMEVEWRIAEHEHGTHVAIVHDLEYPVPVLGRLFATHIVGRVFVHSIADRTLICLKRRVESESHASEGGRTCSHDASSSQG